MTATIVKTLVPIPSDAPGLGYASQSWLPQVQAQQNATSGVVAPQVASFGAGLQWFYPCYANAGNIVVNLPLATTQWKKSYVFQKTDTTANTVTIAPNGVLPDTLNHTTLTLVLTQPYQTAYIVCDGISNWFVVSNFTPGATGGGPPSPTIYTSGSGTFTTSSTTTLIKVILQAAGGNGGTATASVAGGGGGGSGEYCEYIIPVTASTGYAYAVGAAGANTTFTVGSVVYTANFGVSSANANGNFKPGGAGGGRLGPAGGATGNPSAAGATGVSEGAAGETGAISGAAGSGAGAATGNHSGNGGPQGSFLGGAATVGGFTNGGGGAASFFGPGGAGGTATSGAAGANGSSPASTAYGAGGGGAAGGTGGATTAGTGTGGCIIIIPLD